MIRPASAASRATGRRSFASHRDAAGSACDCQGHWWSTPAATIDSCMRVRKEPVQPKQGAKHARANEASCLLAKHAKEEPLDRGMLTLGDSAIATLVKGCAEPFSVPCMRTVLARNPERLVSSTDHCALATKLCKENRQTLMSHKLLSNVVHMTSQTLMQNIYRLGSACINRPRCLLPLHPVARVAERLGADSLLGGCLVRRDHDYCSHDR